MNRTVVPLTALLIDAVLLIISAWIAYVGRVRMARLLDNSPLPASAIPIEACFVVGTLIALWAFGTYRHEIFGYGPEEPKQATHAIVIAAGLAASIFYLTKNTYSRGIFVLFFVAALVLVLAGRFFLRIFLRYARRKNHLREVVLLVGSVGHVDEVASMIRRESWLGFDILGALIDRRDRSIKDHPDPKTLPTSASGVPILGAATVDSVMEHAQGINTVVYAGGAPLSHRERRLLNWELEKLHVHAIIAPGLSDTADHRVQSRHAGGIPLVYVSPPTWTRALRFSKRAFDVILASIAILLTSPLMLWAVIAITVTDGRPIFYRSYRIGREGRPFAFFKFRTMIKDADQLVDTLRDEHGVDDFLFKMQTDPRIIRPGRFMRRWSIDELPQLFNVLKGDMSLIGPRPALQDEVDRYDEIMQRRLRVRPGITGLWQVSGRSDLSLEDSVRLDLYYVDNWSMLQDLTILTKTVLAVLGGKGAY